ncbi:hypothetical protein AQUCO_03800037v1 [Aquilegia coerulea]|uniref:Uncharacterized protein n=1 Tax=Aquilegia coerulea TaxID=218851 RepID=A0A2G5CSC5_AQUCA|nr:hypothetical protein AQUCO_03800037v1 [Aquilegia coerulea]
MVLADSHRVWLTSSIFRVKTAVCGKDLCTIKICLHVGTLRSLGTFLIAFITFNDSARVSSPCTEIYFSSLV